MNVDEIERIVKKYDRNGRIITWLEVDMLIELARLWVRQKRIETRPLAEMRLEAE